MAAPRILIAPSGFKECLDAGDVAAAIGRGIRRASPGSRVIELPLPDGEGFARTIVRTTSGVLRQTPVQGPVGETVTAQWGFLGGTPEPTAIVDMASAAGLALVPRDRRDPLVTSTYGVGELIRAALDGGARRIIVGCGDSGTNDAGAGMAQALGARLLDAQGRLIRAGGIGLLDLNAIDLSGLDPRLAHCRIDVACNLKNRLCGATGVARVYGPQKGASPDAVDALETALERFAAVVRSATGIDVRTIAGGGASGGLGAGLLALLGARLEARHEVLSRHVDLDGHLAKADLVFTAEGGLDGQSARGKIPGIVGTRARRLGTPVIALAGTLGDQAESVRQHGVQAFFSTLSAPGGLEAAIAGAAQSIERCAENVMRTVLVAMRMSPLAPRRCGRRVA